MKTRNTVQKGLPKVKIIQNLIQNNSINITIKLMDERCEVDQNCYYNFLFEVEDELKSTIASWEHDNENLFLVNGERYLDVMERQWLEHEDEKKRAVAERVKLEMVHHYNYNRLLFLQL